MKRRKWDPKTKAMIVLQRIKGKPVGEICLEHQISQTQYYQWRGQFLANAHQVFAGNEKKGELLTHETEGSRQLVKDGMKRARNLGKRIGRPRVIERPDFHQRFVAVVERIDLGILSRRQAAKELAIGYARLKR